MGATHHLNLPANEADGLKLPRLAANRSQSEQSFFASFFQKKKTLALLSLAFLPLSLS
jgi:hypothetical protein